MDSSIIMEETGGDVMSGDEEFGDEIEPQKKRKAFVFDKALFKAAKEAKDVIEKEELEDKNGQAERQVDTVRH